MGSALRRCKNAKAALYNVKNAKIHVKELLGRGVNSAFSNYQRKRERQGDEKKRDVWMGGERDAGFEKKGKTQG